MSSPGDTKSSVSRQPLKELGNLIGLTLGLPSVLESLTSLIPLDDPFLELLLLYPDVFPWQGVVNTGLQFDQKFPCFVFCYICD